MNTRIRILLISLVIVCTTLVLLWGGEATNNFSSKIIGKTVSSIAGNSTNAKKAFKDSVSENGEMSSTVLGPYTFSQDYVFPSFTIYLILDDAGEQLAHLEPFLTLPFSYTVAVIPFLPASKDTVQVLAQNNIPYIIHMPMESSIATTHYQAQIMSDDTPTVITDKLRSAIDFFSQSVPTGISHDQPRASYVAFSSGFSLPFPQAIGFNNHTGSAVSKRIEAMSVVLRFLQSRKLLYLDSKTTPDTVVPRIASDYDIPIVVRDVFLDNSTKIADIEFQLERALIIGLKHGSVRVIGHVTKPETAQVLAKWHKEILKRGGRFETLKRVYSDFYANMQ